VAFALTSAVCLITLIPWELTRDDPIVDLRLLGRRHFGACWLVMLGTGAVLISSTQFLPQILQTDFNYTALLAGLSLSPGGIATLMVMPIVGRLVGIVQPKYLIMVGSLIVTFAMWHLTGLNGDITYGYAAFARVILGIGLPLLFLPVTTASYDGVPPDKTNQASALINVARNLGGSMGVALAIGPATGSFASGRRDRKDLADADRPALLYRRVLDVGYHRRDHGAAGTHHQADRPRRCSAWALTGIFSCKKFLRELAVR
jgi:DHA2 family multidrug resistance protein